jgi:TPR repeat protein
VIIGVTAASLVVITVALLTLPAPDALATRAAPMVADASSPAITPRADSLMRVDSLASASAPTSTPPVKPTAIEKPAAPKPVVVPALSRPKAPLPVKKAVTPPVTKAPAAPVKATAARRRGSLCDEHVTAEAWNDAFEACTAEASQGRAIAQRRLANLYLEGLGTGRNETFATKFFTDAANNGDVESMYQFAVSLERGRGIKKDQSAALRWYTRAGDGGHAAAQYALGQAYERGRLSASKDKRQALEWYRKAAEQNFGDAANKVRDLSR